MAEEMIGAGIVVMAGVMVDAMAVGIVGRLCRNLIRS